MFMQAFTPEQAATGKMENGRDVIILYVKEFSRQCQEVNQSGLNHYRYNWYHNAEKNAYVLHVSWEDKVSLAVRFDQQHFALLAAMVEPKDVILTTIPITELVAKAKESGNSVLDFTGPVVTFSQLIFDDPKQYLEPSELTNAQLN